MKRRQFLKGAVAGLSLWPCFPATPAEVERELTSGKLERRALGKTGAKLSILGFGGIVVKDATPAEAAQRVTEAVDAGVNYFDVAPSYGDAESRLGPALAPYRAKVFLACKTTQRKAIDARRELESSLKTLQTDHLDLYQFHAVTTVQEVDTIFGSGGAMEAFEAAKRDGRIRFIGFSAHSVEAALAMMDRFDFDTILFPFNFTTWHAGNFGPQVLALARMKQMGILALKAMAKGPWPKEARREYPKCWYEPLATPEEAALGLRFTLSHPITAALPPGDERLFKLALGLALKFEPLSSGEVEVLRERARTGEPLFRYPRVV
jgi:predicted aldo/keto reductase-like oxidoreductase